MLAASLAAGCTTSAVRLQSPEADEFVLIEESVKRVGDYTRPVGMQFLKVESVGLATGLHGTGSDPPPNSRRGTLVSEMQQRGVSNPNQVLGSPATSLVLVRGYLPPGIRKGDRFDVEVRVSSKSETASLADGWLMQTRLKELVVLGAAIREGHELGLAEGSIMVDALVEGDADSVSMIRGRVLGGAIAARTRDLGLSIRNQHQSVRISAILGTAINKRFHVFEQGVKRGVANPRTDEYLDLIVHPAYRNNIVRYVRVVDQIPLRMTAADDLAHLQMLERQLLDPATSEKAALKLEAIGRTAADVLAKALKSNDGAVRFYSAEALAYLDDERAVPVLAATARTERGNRWHALTALGAMTELEAYDSLVEMLHVESAEVRYGAFSQLYELNDRDPVISGEMLGGEFGLHELATTGDPMVHISRSRRAEIVIFGRDLQLQLPLLLFAGENLMIDGRQGDMLKITQFRAGQPEQHEYCSTALNDVMRTVVQLGGGYPDVVEVLRKAKAEKYLDARVVVDALPSAARRPRNAERSTRATVAAVESEGSAAAGRRTATKEIESSVR